MDAAPTPSPVRAPAPPPPAELLNAWPRSAQWATAFLLGVAVALLLINSFTYLRWGTRPTELQRGPEIVYHVDLNRAQRPELLQLPGIGETLAQRILEHRHHNGPFQSVDDLRQVPGIGPAVLGRLRPWVRVSVADARDIESTSRTAAQGRTVSVSLSPPANETMARRPGGKKEESLKEPIDVNRASAVELQALPGIGPVLSQRIVNERTKKPFQSVEDLRRVPGVGPKILERIRPYVTVGHEPGRVASAG